MAGIGGVVDFGAPDDRAADRDALARLKRADDGAVHVAVAFELASTLGVGESDVAQRIFELEAGDDDLEAVGLEHLVGADDVERQLATRQVGVRQCVRQLVAVLAGHRLIRVADPDLGLVPVVGEREIVRGVRRAGGHLDRRAEVVRDEAPVAVAVCGPEVLVDHLANAHAAFTCRLHGDLLGVEALRVVARPGPDDPYQGEEGARGDDDDDDDVAPGGSAAEHPDSLRRARPLSSGHQ